MPDKKQQLEQRLNEVNRRAAVRSAAVSYQNDTIKVNPRNYETQAYYEVSTGRIVRNVTSAEKSPEDIRIEVSHEAKHAANARLGIPDVSAEQFYKLQVMDEVSAHIVSVLCWREEYLNAPDKKKFIEEEQSRPVSSRRCPLGYFEAVAEGKIDPASRDPKEFDREMALIARDEFESMSSKYSGYVSQYTSLTRGYMNTTGRDFGENDAEFEKYAKHYMTISGVDFRKYLNDGYMEQIYMPDGIETASKNLAGNSDADEAQLLFDGGMVYDGSVSLEQYHKLLQHKVIANSIMYNHGSSQEKSEMANGSHAYDESITQSYEIFKKLSSYGGLYGSNRMEKQVNDNMALALSRADGNVADNDAEFEKKLKEIYMLPGTNIDLRDHINGFDPDDVPLAESEAVKEFLRDPEKYKAEHPYQRSDQGVLEHNEGDVKWAEHSDQQRVSEVKSVEAFNSEGDFLQAERESRRLQQELEQLKKAEEKKKAQPLTAAPKPVMYKLMDGVKAYFSSGSQQQFDHAELKSVIGDDGSRTDVAYLDGQKHGAEISRDRDGNITDVKFYDHGREMDVQGRQINIESGTREIDGKTESVSRVLLDGKPFGAEVVEGEDGIKADFYGTDGNLISGRNGAEIDVSAEYKITEEEPPRQEETQGRQEDEPVSQKREATEEDYCHEASDTLRRGHNRIAEMRAKMAAGHSERMTAGREEDSVGQRLRELRFDSVRRSQGTITPSRINAQQLRQLLQRSNE